MGEWIERVPNELEVDAVGLWQIIPVGIDSFGLSGGELEDFVRRCIMGLLRRGAVPVQYPEGPQATEYQGSHEEITNQIINDWKVGTIVADHDGLWFEIVSDPGFSLLHTPPSAE